MIPILYDANETEFTTLGLGSLAETIKCTSYREINGEYYIELDYPVKGIRYNDISLRKIIVADADMHLRKQPYRIYNITEPFNGVVTITAKHISQDLSGIPLSPCEATNLRDALALFTTENVVPHNFIFETDRETVAEFYRDYPTSILNAMGGSSGSILDVYSGEWEFDGFHCRLYSHIGSDRGVTISYGKNLTDFEQEKKFESVYTGVYPYWSDGDLIYVELQEKVIPAPGTYDFERILVLDCGEYFNDEPSEEELRARAIKYAQDNDIGIPKVSMKVKFQTFMDLPEFKDLRLLEEIRLGDTVHVRFPMYNVTASARVRSIKYNVLRDRYNEISLGDSKSSLSDTIANQSATVSKLRKDTITDVAKAIKAATDAITGNLGGYVIFRYSPDNKPQEILIMDTEDIATATKVWRWNASGLGYSSHGYNGPYETAITQNGEIVADFITAGELDGSIIKTGTILFSSLGSDVISYITTTVDGVKTEVYSEMEPLVENVEVQYALGDSDSTAPVSGWSTASPVWTPGKYVWQRTVTQNYLGTYSTSDPVCIQGAEGQAGEDATVLRIDSSRGIVFKNSVFGTVLTVTVQRGPLTITDITNLRSEYGITAHLSWSWKREDEGDDVFHPISSDDSRISNDGFTLTVTPADVDEKIVMQCHLEY